MGSSANVIRRGIYNNEYFSGAQVSLYIGDVWVDEITTLAYGYQQSRSPIYGYSSTLFDDVSEGHILVTGQFTLNFKEAGYLWLILDRFREINLKGDSLIKEIRSPFAIPGQQSSRKNTNRQNIEQLVNGELSAFKRNQQILDLAELEQKARKEDKSPFSVDQPRQSFFTSNAASLGGFSSSQRALASNDLKRKTGVGDAEGIFETFEDALWGRAASDLDSGIAEDGRRADDDRLNPFEMYVTFGDFAGDDFANHTIERIRNVYILGKSKQIQIDGMPIQEQYQFIARNLI